MTERPILFNDTMVRAEFASLRAELAAAESAMDEQRARAKRAEAEVERLRLGAASDAHEYRLTQEQFDALMEEDGPPLNDRVRRLLDARKEETK